MRDVLQDVRSIGTRLQKLARGMTHDADLNIEPRGNGVAAEPTVGPERIMKLEPPGTAYSILTEADGDVWLCRHADLEGYGDNGRTTIPTPTGDRALDRHRRIQAQRDAGARFAEKFNAQQRKRWGQA